MALAASFSGIKMGLMVALSLVCLTSAMTISLDDFRNADGVLEDSVLRVVKEKKQLKHSDNVLRGPQTKEIEIASAIHQVVPVEAVDMPCKTVGNSMKCCFQLSLKRLALNDTACLNITYVTKDIGIEAIFTWNGDVMFKRELSARNPPPICAGLPYVYRLAMICLRFTNLDFQDYVFSGCADIEVRHKREIIKKFDMGCFKLPPY